MDQQAVMQQMNQIGPQLSTGATFVMVIIILAMYAFFAYCLARLAKNVGMDFKSSFIWALIPIANAFLIFKIADKPMWWIVLMLIPIVNLVITIIIWMAIAEKLKRPSWWGVVIALVPIVNLILFLILVFAPPEETATPA